jgi:hypothetical protein
MKIPLSVVICLFAITPVFGDYQEPKYVKGESQLTESIIKDYQKTDFSKSYSYVKYKSLDCKDGIQLLSICREDKLPAAYITVKYELAQTHGDTANVQEFVTSFPTQHKVNEPKTSYTLSIEKITSLTDYPKDISMCGLTVFERETHNPTWIKIMVRISFEKDEQLFQFIKKLSPILLSANKRKHDGYISIDTYKY